MLHQNIDFKSFSNCQTALVDLKIIVLEKVTVIAYVKFYKNKQKVMFKKSF